jgi:transposase
MYTDVTEWTKIRRRVLTGGLSQKQIVRETGISRKTVRKMIEFRVPPGYRREKSVDRPKLGPCLGVIDQIVQEDRDKPKKQRYTAKRIYDHLKEEHGFSGGYTVVKDYMREARRRIGDDSTLSGASDPSFESVDPAQVVYEIIQSVPKREAIELLRTLFGGGNAQIDRERLDHLIATVAVKETRAVAKRRASQTASDWMRKVLQGEEPLNVVAKEVGDLLGLNDLLAAVAEGRLAVRNRALAVLARKKGIRLSIVCAFLNLCKRSVLKYCRHYDEGGVELLMAKTTRSSRKFDKDSNRQAIFSLIHTPPSNQGINRTTWRMADLEEVLRRQGTPLCREVIRKILKEAGFKWRSARVVLTSTDPEYRSKVESIKGILAELGQDEAFFSIDEYGPFAVKKKGGVKRVAPGQDYVVPQWQKSKGWMILTAALELSTNQVTHFFSRAKNTEEMIKMADLLRAQYHTCRTTFPACWPANDRSRQ